MARFDRRSDHHGFTLLELMVTLAVAAVVLTLGVPSFQALIRSNRLTTLTNELVGALHLTRSEAIKRNHRVTLCKSANGAQCASGDQGYEQGWIVFDDPNNNATVDSGETIIRVFAAAPAGMTLTGNTNVAHYISYTATGTSHLVSNAFQAGTLTVCLTPEARDIVINSVGRVRTEPAPDC